MWYVGFGGVAVLFLGCVELVGWAGLLGIWGWLALYSVDLWFVGRAFGVCVGFAGLVVSGVGVGG